MSRIRLLVLALSLLMPALAWGATSHPGAALDSSWVGALPYVTSISTLPTHPNPHEPTRLVIEGRFPNDCGELRDPGPGVVVWIHGLSNCGDSLGTIPTWRREFDLGQLASGTFRILVTLYVDNDQAPVDPLVYTAYYEFEVHDSIPPGPLPFVNQILIGPAPHGPGVRGPICPGDSILVTAFGTFPNACFRLLRIDVLPSPIATPLPEPPVVRFVIDVRDCVRHLCAQVLTSWEGHVVLPPLPARGYRLITEVGMVTCPDTIPADSAVYSTAIPFRVETCELPASCVIGSWVPGDARCDAHVAPDGHADVTFAVQSGIALAGLQGSFAVDPGAMRITRIQTIGPAGGMHIQWRATKNGAKFTMFAEHGAPISGAPGDSMGLPVPILRLTLERLARQLPPVTYVFANELLGSDQDGNAVPECRIEALVAIAARICSESGCDFNADGASDVRDLVLMARCVLATATDSSGNVFRQLCADSAAVPDCNADGEKTIADVICCAIHTLRGSSCPNCPPDTTKPKPAPGVRVVLGAPVIDAVSAELTVSVLGINDLGGIVMRLDYPAERYDAEVRPAGEWRGWMTLSDVLDGTATIGLVRAEDPLKVHLPDALRDEMKLRLTLKPGQTHGGVVKLADVELSDPAGAKLDAGSQTAVAALGGRALLTLSQARPNPSAGVTRFGLTLDRASTVTVAIYDLGGRLVSTLHRGPLGAGAHEFAWDGLRGSGTAAPGGVYFYRATSGSVTASSKLVLLGN